MPWSNPGPAKRVVIEAGSGDLLAYDGNVGFGDPLGTLIAALSGNEGVDPYGFRFFQGLSLQHNGPGVNFSINGSPGRPDTYGELFASVDGLLKNHLTMLGPGLSSPKGKIDLNLDTASLGNDTGDSGISVANVGGVSIFTKAGTSVSLGGTVILGNNSTAFAQLEFGTGTLSFAASASSSAATVNFPTAFPSAPSAISLTSFAGTGGRPIAASYFNVTANGFQVNGRVVDGTAITGNIPFTWEVIQ